MNVQRQSDSSQPTARILGDRFPTSDEPRGVAPEKSKSLVPASVANFGVQYNYGNIAIALAILEDEDLYQDDDIWGGVDKGLISSLLKSIIFFGSICGMVTMGFVGDVLGRNRAFSLTCMIMVVSALLSASLTIGNGNTFYAMLAISRFCLGFGIGGCYPLSAIKSSEEAGTGASIWERNYRTGVTFCWQTVGAMGPYLMGMLMVSVTDNVQWQFRVVLGLGCLPPAYTAYKTWWEEDSKEFRQKMSEQKKPFLEQLRLGMADPDWKKHYAATGLCWFIYDVAYYGNALFTPTMTAKIFTGDSIFDIAWESSVDLLLGIPATILALYHLKVMGTKWLQVWGFMSIAVCCGIIAALWRPLGASDDDDGGGLSSQSASVLFTLFCFLQFSCNWGANMTTYVLPQQIYPTEIRGTFNGVASASGKFGALLGIWIFDWVYSYVGLVYLMVLICSMNVVGALVSKFCISDELWNTQKAQMLRTPIPQSVRAD